MKPRRQLRPFEIEILGTFGDYQAIRFDADSEHEFGVVRDGELVFECDDKNSAIEYARQRAG
jgi:hypothetical protein